jgi:hypothetical protein
VDQRAAWRELPVGTRVVVRTRLNAAEAEEAKAAGQGAVWSDVIGIVVSSTDDELVLRRDSPRKPADLVVIGCEKIHTYREIPPRPTRVRRMEP